MSAPTTSYDLADWPERARRDLDELVGRRGIVAQWQDRRMTVATGVRAEVDDLIAYLNGSAAPGATRTHPLGSAGVPGPAPAWYPDPEHAATWRWWDGNRWTAFSAPAPVPVRAWFPPRGEHGRETTALTGGGGIALVGFVLAEAASVGAVLLAVELGVSRRSVATLAVAGVTLWAGLLLACVVAVRRHGSGSLRDLGLVGLRRADVGAGIVSSIVARIAGAAAAAGLILVLPDESYGESTSLLDQDRPGVAAAIVVVLVVVIGAPFVEELFFRGLVQTVLVRRLGAAPALVVQAITFGAVHYQVGMAVGNFAITLAVISIAGLTLGIVRWHYGRLGPAIVAHAAFNLVAVVVTFLVL